MAHCDEGYLCQVCGAEVKRIDQSSLYLRYVVGWIAVSELNKTPEAHLRCVPSLAQFIVDADFPPVVATGNLSKHELDPDFRHGQELRVTAGYHRLKYLQKHRRNVSISKYPLSEADVSLSMIEESAVESAESSANAASIIQDQPS